MNRKLRLSSIIIASALLLSGCSEKNTPGAAGTGAPAASAETTTTTSAAPGTIAAAETSQAETTSPAVTVTSEEDTEPAAAVTELSADTSEAPEETIVVFTTAATTDETTAETSAATTAEETKAPETSETTEPPAGNEAPAPDDILPVIDSGGEPITTDTEKFTISVEYNGADENASYYTGPEFRIERLTDGQWTDFPFIDIMAWDCVVYTVSMENSPVIDIPLFPTMYAEPFTPGTYRVCKNVGGTDFYAEFDIEAGSTDPHIQVYNETGAYDLVIDEIKDDEYICYNLYPLPYVFRVVCDTAQYEDYCVGDQINVVYDRYWFDPDDPDTLFLSPEYISPSYTELEPDVCYKPVIYLYPEEETDVTVKLGFNGRLTVTDPEYGEGWTVTARPDGTLICGGEEYPYLFWEGDRDFDLDTSAGFCVNGEDTEEFLLEKLAYLGLNEHETAEFMEFWLPYMRKNPYNVITFAGTDYTDNAALDISPAPDTVIRVFMVFSPVEEYVDIPAQTLEKAPERSGFTVVEWGGTVK